MNGTKRAVIVICDSLRADLIGPDDTPFLLELGERGAWFTSHRSVFPSTTRASAASIATGCLPARHGLLGNTMALDEGDGLVLPLGRASRFPGPDAPRDRPHAARADPGRAAALARRSLDLVRQCFARRGLFPGPGRARLCLSRRRQLRPGTRPVDDPASAALNKGLDGDRAMTERFCSRNRRERAPSLAIMWLSEPDYSGHHSPLGSPEHREAIRHADRCVRQVFETVRRLDPTGEEILFVTGSDHGMETVSDAIDLDGLLIAAGLKQGPGSRDVVVAPNGTAATLYFAEPDSDLPARVARFLAAENWAGEVFIGEALSRVGLPTDTAMRVAVTLAAEDRDQPARHRRLSARSCRTRPTMKARSASASMAGSARTSSARS